MKKILTALAVVLFSISGINAIAQDNQTTPGQNNKMYQPREFTEFAFEGILLDLPQQTRIDSLNAAVKAKCATQAPACKADKQCNKAKCDKDKCDKAKCDKAKCDKGKCDKAKCDKPCDKAKCDKDGKCDKGSKGDKGPKCQGMRLNTKCPYGQEYMAKVKEILTPEQYTIFLENIVSMPGQKGPQMHQGHMNCGQHSGKPHKMDKDGKKAKKSEGNKGPKASKKSK